MLGKIFLVLEIVYKFSFCFLVIFFGQSLDEIFDLIFPNDDSLELINKYFFDYVFLDYTMRVFFQGNNLRKVSGYLVLPIKKAVVLSYVLINQMWCLINFFSLVLFISLSIYFIIPRYGMSTGILWVLGSLGIIFTNDLVLRRIKAGLSFKFLKIILPLIGFLLIFKNTISWIPYGSLFVFNPYFAVLSFLTYCFIVYYYILFVSKQLYKEASFHSFREVSFGSESLKILSRLGLVGELLILEWRLSTRNRRPKDLLIISVVLIIYLMVLAFKVLADASLDSHLLFLYSISMFSSLSIMVNYGQFVYGWEGRYFDCILTNKISLRAYIKAKRIWLSGCCCLGLLFTLPFTFANPGLLKYLFPSFFIGLGITLPLMIFFANYNRKSIDLSIGVMFNYEGINAFQYLNMGINIVLQGIVLFPFWLFESTESGIWILGGIGMISSFLGPQWDRVQEKLFYKYKYVLAESLRK